MQARETLSAVSIMSLYDMLQMEEDTFEIGDQVTFKENAIQMIQMMTAKNNQDNPGKTRIYEVATVIGTEEGESLNLTIECYDGKVLTVEGSMYRLATKEEIRKHQLTTLFSK